MKTQSVYNAENSNANIIAAGIGGASVGALASRFAPLTHNEHYDAVASQVKNAKINEFKSIADEIAKNKELSSLSDVFVKSEDAIVGGAKDKISDIAQNLDDNGKAALSKFVKRIEDVGHNAGTILEPGIVKQVKKSRPAFYFAIIAAATSMTAAVLKNVISAKRAQNSAVAINYDKDGMIIDAPDNMSLAIVLDQTA